MKNKKHTPAVLFQAQRAAPPPQKSQLQAPLEGEELKKLGDMKLPIISGRAQRVLPVIGLICLFLVLMVQQDMQQVDQVWFGQQFYS